MVKYRTSETFKTLCEFFEIPDTYIGRLWNQSLIDNISLSRYVGEHHSKRIAQAARRRARRLQSGQMISSLML
jgi:hypothetical protein